MARTKVWRSESTRGVLGTVKDQSGEIRVKRMKIKLESGFIGSWLSGKAVDWEDTE